MAALQNHIRKTLHTKPQVNAGAEIRYRVKFLKDFLLNSGAKGYVLGVSGGMDSALVGKLAQLAITELQQEGHDDLHLHAMLLPYETQTDIDDAQHIATEFINADRVALYNIGNTVNAFTDAWELMLGEGELSNFNKGNLKARMRMVAQYAYASEKNLLVLGTSNAAEELTGFFTKYGDGASDVNPNTDLTKRQVRLLLAELNVPDWLLEKTPTADLLDGVPAESDEVALGVSYDDIDDYLEGQDISDNAVERIELLFMKSEHKRKLPMTLWG